MTWFKVVLRRIRTATVVEEKIVAVSARHEADLEGRLSSEVYAQASEDGWDGDELESGTEETEEEHEIVGEIEDDEDMNVCSQRIKLKRKRTPGLPGRKRLPKTVKEGKK